MIRDEYAGRRLLKLVNFFSENYFRTRFFSAEPEVAESNEPVIFAGNHSGMSFPWDNFVLFDHLLSHYSSRRQIRGLMSPMMIGKRLLSPFAMHTRWNYFSEPATMKDFNELAGQGYSILINPEGLAGIGKGFNRRYQLQKMSTSFVRMSIKYNRAIVPVSVVNGEYLNPYAYSSRIVNRAANAIGLPFLPIGFTILLALLIPLAFYIALPARLRYVFGKRIYASQFTSKRYEELTDTEVREIAGKIHAQMQENLNHAVAEHGTPAFGWMELFARAKSLGARTLGLVPLTWPFLAHRAFLGERYSLTDAAISTVTCLAMCVPLLGWPLVLLTITVARLFEHEKPAAQPAAAAKAA